MNIEQARFNMVEQQIRPWEVLDQSVLDLLYVVRREEFVPEAYKSLAFSDLEIPIGEGERMLQPKVEARILQEVAPKRTDRVLEVGTGSGYLTALLAHRAQHVYSVEISPTLLAFGEANLRRAGVDNVTLEQGDGARGWSKHAPYDVIVLGGSTPVLADELLAQLKVGGRLFAIVGEEPVMQAQLITCTGPGSYNTIGLFETCVAPLKNAPQPARFEF
ncbi:MAG: protein-L-isoaspartate O-methyltransferase [Burkholderiales bacterium]|mgnify:FL=1|nr:protein-L-isoaspartate O-methyltransferase [Burkholderiales bacterium]PZN06252.1 MAG: protein-L-isoaspartate O-methyltransferase [Pseudomonadota bacterium]